MEILIISGLSGAGKSSAATYLEDMGYYTVDNVPADIILKFAEFCAQSDGRYDRVALVSDIRSGNGNFQGILDAMERLKQGGDICRLLFVTADLETIIKRYKETRRRHPLMSDGMTIEQAMHREQELLLDGEQIVGAYKTVRDQVVFTTHRIILVDMQGVTGTRQEIFVLPYRKVLHFGIQTAGFGDPLQASQLTVCFADEHEAKFGFIGQDDLFAVANAISRRIL